MTLEPEAGARRIVTHCLAVRPGESVGLLVDDDTRFLVAEHLQTAIGEVGGDAHIIRITDSQVAPDLVTEDLPEDLMGFDVVVGLTARSMYHASLGREVARRGGRVLALTQSDLSSLTSAAMGADFLALSPYAEALCERLDGASRIRVVTASGTDVEAVLDARPGYTCTGLAREAGVRNGCPDIEGYIAPVESSVNGIVVVDASSTPFGLLTEPVTLEFEAGRMRRISGGEPGALLGRYLVGLGPEMQTFAEFGFGLNPHCRVVGRIVEDEGTYGTGHVAVGSNDGFGGASRAPAHVDLVYWHPTVLLDDIEVFRSGSFVAEPAFATQYEVAVPGGGSVR